MKLTLELLEDDAKIQQRIHAAVATSVNKAILKARGRIRTFTSRLFVEMWREHNTYDALTTGDLRGDFGFPRGTENRVDLFLEGLRQGIVTNYEFMSATQPGELTIGLKTDAFLDMLERTQIITKKNERLKWAEWLLTRGDSIIISEHSIRFIPGKGRSGLAIMVADGKSWGVPPEHAGTIEDNWLTRSLNGEFTSRLGKLIDEEISRSVANLAIRGGRG